LQGIKREGERGLLGTEYSLKNLPGKVGLTGIKRWRFRKFAQCGRIDESV